jgi:hypothetical protein
MKLATQALLLAHSLSTALWESSDNKLRSPSIIIEKLGSRVIALIAPILIGDR